MSNTKGADEEVGTTQPPLQPPIQEEDYEKGSVKSKDINKPTKSKMSKKSSTPISSLFNSYQYWLDLAMFIVLFHLAFIRSYPS